MSKTLERGHGRGWAYALAVALVCAGGLAHTGAGALAAGSPATHTVVIEDTAYAPAILTVKRGDTVVWINKDMYPHTVTAKGVFDSHSIAVNGSWKYTAREAGEFAYICTLHPTMKGTLKVE
jgi:plastocyanin